jgi:hypothetical protein
MERNVKSGDEPGLLAYRDGRAIGWISVAPREQFGQLMRSRSYAPTESEEGRGARAIDAFPATVPARSDYMGALSLYEELGFLPVRTVSTRTLVRLAPAR